MRKRNAVRAAAAALAATMVLTACGGGGGNETTAAAGGDTGSTAAGGDAAASGSGEVGKTDITVAMGADIVTLDPAGQQDTTTAVVIKHAYSTLLDISDEGELVPDLAELRAGKRYRLRVQAERRCRMVRRDSGDSQRR